jgi:RNA polymerase sigma-70 factor, ECF subfamily
MGLKITTDIPPMEDARILSLLLADDVKGYEHLFLKYYAPMCHTALTMLKDENLAEDIVQQIYLKLCKKGFKKQNREVPIDNLGGYLTTCVKRECLNFLKKQALEKSLPQKLNPMRISVSPQTQLEQKELYQHLTDALESLPAKCRKIFEWSYLHGLSYKEIAKKEQISTHTVDNHIAKALRLLRVKLSPIFKESFLALALWIAGS